MPEKRLHVLVVEDDPDVAGTIAGLLDDAGFRVTVAADGASMRDFLTTGDPVDAAILDVQLPGEQGDSLAEFAKSLGLSVILCSGSISVIQLARQHNQPILEKPFRRKELIDALRNALAHRNQAVKS